MAGKNPKGVTPGSIKPYLWQKGESGNPAGRHPGRSPIDELLHAVEAEGRRRGLTMWEHLAKLVFKDRVMARAVMDKLVPTLTHNESNVNVTTNEEIQVLVSMRQEIDERLRECDRLEQLQARASVIDGEVVDADESRPVHEPGALDRGASVDQGQNGSGAAVHHELDAEEDPPGEGAGD